MSQQQQKWNVIDAPDEWQMEIDTVADLLIPANGSTVHNGDVISLW